MIYLGTDHRGFKVKEELKSYLAGRGYQIEDLGAGAYDPSDDYPEVARRVARKVTEDPNNRGILLCGSAAGVCIVANKIKGVRAAPAWNAEQIWSMRNDDNLNVLCLAADYTSAEKAKKITQAFLDASFSGEERHKRRLKEIEEIEENN